MLAKRILSGTITFLVGFSSFGGGLLCIAADAEDNTKDLYAVYKNVLEYKTEEVVSSLAEIDVNYDNEPIIIKQVKLLKDFSDGEYILVEFNDAGYYIYDPDSGIVVESSLTATSPYSEYSDALYYVGPNEYYHWDEEENVYEYTLNHEILDDELKDECQNVSIQIKNKLHADSTCSKKNSQSLSKCHKNFLLWRCLSPWLP